MKSNRTLVGTSGAEITEASTSRRQLCATSYTRHATPMCPPRAHYRSKCGAVSAVETRGTAGRLELSACAKAPKPCGVTCDDALLCACDAYNCPQGRALPCAIRNPWSFAFFTTFRASDKAQSSGVIGPRLTGSCATAPEDGDQGMGERGWTDREKKKEGQDKSSSTRRAQTRTQPRLKTARRRFGKASSPCRARERPGQQP